MAEVVLNDLPYLFRFITNLIAGLGILLIVYGFVSQWTGEKFGPLEKIAEKAAAVVTLIGTALTAASVYFSEVTPPESVSRHFTASALIVGCVAALILVFRGIAYHQQS